MAQVGPLVLVSGSDVPRTVLRTVDEWGLLSADLLSPPRRFWGDEERPVPTVISGTDVRRLTRLPTPAESLQTLKPDETWASISKRSLARLRAYFLIAEDPQRRLDARPVSTLAHQVSLVRHILDNNQLRRVLVADEVGLGKTVEAGLLVKELLEHHPGLRILYLAPARLVSNVRLEFDRMGLRFRQWSACDSDARLTDPLVIASIHKAVHGENRGRVTETTPWDVIIVDECHHLSDWAEGGGDPREKFRLVRDLISRQGESGRVILLSGTPHQGHVSRFDNLVRLLKRPDEPSEALAGRIIYRTKDEIKDWNGKLLFPRRQVNEPIVVDLGPAYRQWLKDIHSYYRPHTSRPIQNESWRRAAAWRCAQALQWAASSPQAGIGYLVRQAMRAGWTLERKILRDCLQQMRPYRGGAETEPVELLFRRIEKELVRQSTDADIDDIEEAAPATISQDDEGLESLLRTGLEILESGRDAKWESVRARLLAGLDGDKVVLFAQPIETVTALAAYLQRVFGKRPSLIIGGQSDSERKVEVDEFRRPDGAQFLVSSRAGGEGINLQIAHRLIHIDVPWNPMELEQRIGRVHRFGSRRTIVVDTVVVKDSREAQAYKIAREKLRIVTSTMVDAEKFEAVFNRVMSLVPPEALQDVLINEATTPLNSDDQDRIAGMVQEGFRTWSDFHDRFADQQRQIRALDSGLATWADLARFAEDYCAAEQVPGFVSVRYETRDDAVVSEESDVQVLRFADGSLAACQETQGAVVYGPNGTSAPQIGLNVPRISETLRQLALSSGVTGAAHLRWPQNAPIPAILGDAKSAAILGYYRQTIATNVATGWTEISGSLHLFGLRSDGETVQFDTREGKRQIWDGLLQAAIRIRPDLPSDFAARIAEFDTELANQLRRPSETEIAQGIRFGVVPILAAVFSFERS